MIVDRSAGASFDQGQVDRLRRAFDIARLSFCPSEPLDVAVSRKLTSALIRYASRDPRCGSDEIARLAVMHVKVASAPLEF